MTLPARKPSVLLFVLRLFFYLSAVALVLLHPGITISYDRFGVFLWFVNVPMGMLIAFIRFGGKLRAKLIAALFALSAAAAAAGGFSPGAVPVFAAGAVSFGLTLLLFHYPRRGKLSLLEPFFLAWVCLRLLAFFRSGEDTAAESSGLTQFILVWTGTVFLFHSAVVYFALYPRSSGGVKTEAAVFTLAAAAALAAAVFILPADFVSNSVIANLLSDKVERLVKESDSEWGMPDTGGGRRQSRDTVPGNGDGQTPGLRGLSEHDWPGEGSRRGGRNGSGGEQQQYTVMVVASKQEPVYMGNNVKGVFDPVEGFAADPDEPLNRLPVQRLFVTWFDREYIRDRGRQRFETFALSTLPQKYLPYRPTAVEPTVLSEGTGPFRYMHRVASSIHADDPLNLMRVPVRSLSALERTDLAPFLELPLYEQDRDIFENQLALFKIKWEQARGRYMGDNRNDYMETILAVLTGFSEFQYNANEGNEAPVQHLVNFLAVKDGDCVEFSNTAALLGRLAGVPSRVVTGYLAAEGLQTQAHLRGLAALRSRIPVLQEFPFEDLFLVTDAHGHSWPQFYIPDYGWVDFEATQFAIPPIGFGDGNLRDVVIPLLDKEDQLFSQVRAFPWRQVLRALALIAVLALTAAYLLRYGRELVFAIGVKRGGIKGARSLYLLLLSRLAADGKPIKPVSKTAPEYSKLFQTADDDVFAEFAAVYTELRWRTFSDRTEEDKRLGILKGEYRRILAETRRRGIHFFFIRLFSLRPLAYL